MNEVFTSVWNFMGLYPLLYAAMLIPGARSNKVCILAAPCNVTAVHAAAGIAAPPAAGQ